MGISRWQKELIFAGFRRNRCFRPVVITLHQDSPLLLMNEYKSLV